MKVYIVVCATLLFLSTSLVAADGKNCLDHPVTTIRWYWEDKFEVEEKAMIETWLNQVITSMEETLGYYPFEMHLHIFRRENRGEPVPWANTRRHPTHQGVDFHVDPGYSLKDFLEDWTAPHEISHLSIPYLGRENAWFAEGYASFMQYQIMQRLGIYSADQVKEKYQNKLEQVSRHYAGTQDVVSKAREMQKNHRYPEMYWGGASFFMRLDKLIKEKQKGPLSGLISEYLKCCRMTDHSVYDVLSSWDEILNSSVCKELWNEYNTRPASSIFNH